MKKRKFDINEVKVGDLVKMVRTNLLHEEVVTKESLFILLEKSVYGDHSAYTCDKHFIVAGKPYSDLGGPGTVAVLDRENYTYGDTEWSLVEK